MGTAVHDDMRRDHPCLSNLRIQEHGSWKTRRSRTQAAEKRIDRVAEKAAGKAAKTEQSYDQDHSIFSK
jgi:hypothetical protein